MSLSDAGSVKLVWPRQQQLRVVISLCLPLALFLHDWRATCLTFLCSLSDHLILDISKQRGIGLLSGQLV